MAGTSSRCSWLLLPAGSRPPPLHPAAAPAHRRLPHLAAPCAGHGGVTDRFDCQVMMGIFSYVYYWAYVSRPEMTVPDVLQSALKLGDQHQVELFMKLGNLLVGEGILPGGWPQSAPGRRGSGAACCAVPSMVQPLARACIRQLPPCASRLRGPTLLRPVVAADTRLPFCAESVADQLGELLGTLQHVH